MATFLGEDASNAAETDEAYSPAATMALEITEDRIINQLVDIWGITKE